MAKARVLIADDHEVVRQGILSLVKMLNQFEVCGEAMDGRDVEAAAHPAGVGPDKPVAGVHEVELRE